MPKAKDNTTHYAYDYGVLNFLGLNKTKTTVCNKRVKLGQIDNRYPTCPECLRIHEEAKALACILLTSNERK